MTDDDIKEPAEDLETEGADAGDAVAAPGAAVPGSFGMDDPLGELMDTNFLEYAAYVIKDRAIPDVYDGLKPVQRRILHSLWKMDDGRFHKVANVIGQTMQYHPHGDASIGDALVVLANKEYFIDRQGNFGNMVITVANAGWQASGTGTITFPTRGSSVILQYVNSKWFCIGNNGATFA
jgi:topoisomerase-4 subunit A